MTLPVRIEGYAIVSEDGMLADARGVMPETLKIEADQRFFEAALDSVDVIVHGRHSHEHQPRSPLRRRLIVTRRVAAIAPDPANPNARLWNPAGLSFEHALAAFDAPIARAGIVGGTEVFGWFLPHYDVFYLSRVRGVHLHGGRPVFPDVPAQTPEHILSAHGMTRGKHDVLDAERGLTLTAWERGR